MYTSKLPGSNQVVVCAPTGTAARSIQGLTLHSLLSIPVQNYTTYEELSSFMLK